MESVQSIPKMVALVVGRQQSGRNYGIVVAKACKTSAEFWTGYCGIINYLRDDKFDRFYEKETYSYDNKSCSYREFLEPAYSLSRIDALSCLTCLTDIEQKTIFEIIADFSYQQRNKVIPILQYVYPSLFYYLQNDKQPNSANLSSDHEQYFNEYKWLKATDTLSEEFIAKVKRIASEKGSSVFQMESRNHYVTEHYDDRTSILFVDGMGVEYVDYLAHLFSDLDEQQYSVKFEAGFALAFNNRNKQGFHEWT